MSNGITFNIVQADEAQEFELVDAILIKSSLVIGTRFMSAPGRNSRSSWPFASLQSRKALICSEVIASMAVKELFRLKSGFLVVTNHSVVSDNPTCYRVHKE